MVAHQILVLTVGVRILRGRIFDKPKGLLWMAFLILPVYVYRQFWDLLLYYGVLYSAVATVLMLVVTAVTAIRRPAWKLPQWLGYKWINAAVMLATTIYSVYILTGLDPKNADKNALSAS